MSDFGQDATASFITHAWKFIKGGERDKQGEGDDAG